MRGRAFTLIELLLAVAITAVVAGVLLVMLRTGLTAGRTIARASGASRTLVWCADHIAGAIASARPPRGLISGPCYGTDGTTDSHDSDTLIFHAAVDPLDSGWGDVVEIELTLESQTDGSQNLIQITTRNPLSPGDTPTQTTVLCRGARSLNFRYFDGTGWYDSWDSVEQGNTLPEAVEVTLTLDPTDTSDTSAEESRRIERLVALPCAIGQEVSP